MSSSQVSERYVLQEKIGEGGFGVVWRALDRETGAEAAIKLLEKCPPEERRRFDVEARAIGQIQHANCVRLLDAGTAHDGVPYLVTEFVEGTDLDAWMKHDHDIDELCRVAAGITDGLHAAHREGIVHRDLKPANVMVRASNGEPCILDFGIAKLTNRQFTDITKTGEVIGTPGYMSPEQLLGARDIGPESDMYSLGVMLFTMFERRPPFVGDNPLQISMEHLQAPIPPMTRAPAHIAELTRQLLDKQPTPRPSAIVASRVLRGGVPIPSRATPATSANASWLAVAAAAVVLVVAAGAYLFSLVSQESPPPSVAHTRPNPLAAPADPPSAPSAPVAPDLGATADVTLACPGFLDEKPGRHEAANGSVVVLPDGYSPARKYPVVMFFHDAYQPPGVAVENVDFTQAGANDYVFVFPEGDHARPDSLHWVDEKLVDAALSALDQVQTWACIDRDRLFVVGHGMGGMAAEHMRCRGQGRAFALFGHRHKPQRTYCEKPAPQMVVLPVDDPTAPRDGGRGCNEARVVSIDAQLEALRRYHRCDGAVPAADADGCSDLRCETPLQVCYTPGSRRWKANYSAAAQLTMKLRRCSEVHETTFPMTRRMLEFFARSDDGVDLGR